MSVTPFRRAGDLTPAQIRIETIIKAAAELGIGGFALAQLRTTVTEQIEPLTEALKPFAAFAEKAEQFVDARVEDGGSPIMPTKDFRLSDFRRARDLLKSNHT
jgi:hypothetical protein